MKRILVVRYGAFGDLVMAMGAFRTIRAYHLADRISILTTRPFIDLLDRSQYFDDVLIDDRLKPWQLSGWLRLARELRDRRFDRVYDLQRNQRTSILYRILAAGRSLEWSGVVPGCSHFVADNPSERRHVMDTLADQLVAAGIPEPLAPDISWLSGDVSRFQLAHRYALMVPGGAPHRPEKRAPSGCFADLGLYLASKGISPVLLGTVSERERIDEIRARCGDAVDLCDKTKFGDIAELARGAIGAVGNDTGSMHLIAQAGCPSLVLFSAASDPDQISPRGRCVKILKCETLAALSVDPIIEAWEVLVDGGCRALSYRSGASLRP
jgi:ADP-heptose:LPS heptosyltransferase